MYKFQFVGDNDDAVTATNDEFAQSLYSTLCLKNKTLDF